MSPPLSEVVIEHRAECLAVRLLGLEVLVALAREAADALDFEQLSVKLPVAAMRSAIAGIERQFSAMLPASRRLRPLQGSATGAKFSPPGANSSPIFGARTAWAYWARNRSDSIGAYEMRPA